jgi:DegV family protein with EDD domain
MANIQLITDSMTDLPKNLIDQYAIEVIPLTIIFGDEEYADGEDMTCREFYEKLETSAVLPKTSQVTPDLFQKAFEAALQNGKEVICINASSKASGTHQSALIAKEAVGSEKIQVIDTMSLSMGAGLTVIETAKQIETGATLEEASLFAQSFSKGVDHLFTVDTVKYLQKGGRINPGKALVANILNIKPILTLSNGLVDPLDKVRGSKKVIGKMIELAKSRGSHFSNATVVIAHANVPDRAKIMKQQVNQALVPKEIIITEIGCTIGTHVGPGTLALFYHK